jgi:hypothetical protein
MKAALEKTLVTSLSALLVGMAAAGEPASQREVLEHHARPQQNLIPDPEIPIPDSETRIPDPKIPIPDSGIPVAPASVERASPARHNPSPWLAAEERLWGLLQAGRLDDLEDGIRETKRRYPDWSPPSRMTRLLDEARQRRALATAEGEALISLARTMPEHFACQQINHLWRLADAYLDARRPDDALDVYRRILDECADAGHRLAIRAGRSPGCGWRCVGEPRPDRRRSDASAPPST